MYETVNTDNLKEPRKQNRESQQKSAQGMFDLFQDFA